MVDLSNEAYDCAKSPKYVALVFKEELSKALGSANRFVIYQEYKKAYKEHSQAIDRVYEMFN